MRRVFFNLTTRRIMVWWWSQRWFLVYLRRLHLPSPRGTPSQAVRADWRIISSSNEIYWRYQNYSYEFGCQARKAHRWFLEYRSIKRFVWSLDRFHSIYSIGRETSRRIYVVRGEINEKTNDFKARQNVARNVETYVRCINQNVARWMWSPTHALNRRRRAREGPEPCIGSGTCRGGRPN